MEKGILYVAGCFIRIRKVKLYANGERVIEFSLNSKEVVFSFSFYLRRSITISSLD